MGFTAVKAPAEPLRSGRSLTDRLCTRCGLCCDGSLFADVELAGRTEATRLEILGLEIEDDEGHGAQLQLPCRALQGTRCTVYAHRPSCCRSFECRVLQDVRRGATSETVAGERIAETRRQIARLRELLARLGPCDREIPLLESCADALAREVDDDPTVARQRAELEAAMSAITNSIRTTFLGQR